MTQAEAAVFVAAQAKIDERKAMKATSSGALAPRSGSRVRGLPKRGKSVTRPISAFGQTLGREAWLYDNNAMLSDLYRYLRRWVPLINNGIATWVDLCTAGSAVQLDGGTPRQKDEATVRMKALSQRVYQYIFDRGDGMKKLDRLFFGGLFTGGRFAAEIVPYPDLSGISHVVLPDAFAVEVGVDADGKKIGMKDYVTGAVKPLPVERMFFTVFEPDESNPYGRSLLDSILWVTEIKERLYDDMAKSSHNAAYRRYAISVEPPPVLPGEAPTDYESRADDEFEETEKIFRDLDVDDNLVFWSNTNVSVLGAQQSALAFEWASNVGMVANDIMAGLRLPSWALNWNLGTTKNWVGSQHDLLMQRVNTVSEFGADFMDWVCNTDLAMSGSPVRCHQTYKPIRDPGALIAARADKFLFDVVDMKVTRGYISKDDGAREMGYNRAYNQD